MGSVTKSLSYVSAGRAARAELVLVHAFPLDHRLWRHVLDEPPDGARVTAIDMPGFGATSLDVLGAEPRYDFDEIADLLAGTLSGLGIERAVFGGCSMGGFVCFAMLRRHPEMVAGLLLSDTRATGDTADARTARVRLIELVESDGVTAIADLMAGRLLGPTTLSSRPDVVEEVRFVILEQPAETITTALSGMAARPDSTGMLASIDMPTSVVVGSEDPSVPVSEATALADAIPTAELVVIDGTGHLPSLEDPAAFGLALRDVVERVGG